MSEEQDDHPRSRSNDAAAGTGDRRSLWRRIAGDGSHLGFWTLPVFVATALGGAVIAGALAQVYYAQQVDQLEQETQAARSAAEVAAEDIEAAREEALEAISEELDGVRDALEVARPLEDPAAAGVVALTIELTPEPAPSPTPQPQASPTPGGSEEGDQQPPGGDGEVQGAPRPPTALAATDEEPAEDAADGEGGAAGGSEAPAAPPPPVEGAPSRRAAGFTVAVEGGASFVATTYGAVADPQTPDGVARAVTVATPAGSARGVVHAWDDARGVAVVRVDLPDLPVLPWRPAAVAIEPGDVAVLAAVTPGLVGVQLPGRVGAVTDTVLVTDLPVDPVFDGAPLVDSVGRVIGLQSSTAAPFGDGSTGAITARQLCVELISGCDLLEQADDEVEEEDQTDG